MAEGFFNMLVAEYGPYTFGMGSLFALWYFIVKPFIASQKESQDKMLEASKLDREGMALLAQSMSSTTDSLQVTSMANERTAASLERSIRDLKIVTEIQESTKRQEGRP